jgi:WD40 repeat protein
MAFGMGDGTMRLIDPVTGDQVNSPVARNGTPIYRVAFNDSGTSVVSSDDDALTLWDGKTGEELENLPIGQVGEPMFTDRGARVVLVTGGARTYTWRLGSDEIQPALCQAAGRNLTSDEWATYLPGRPYQKTCPRYR